AFLCVGGIAPHKAQHELVTGFAVYRRVFDPRARLSLVGRIMAPGYGAALVSLISSLGLEDAVELAGAVTHEQLVAYFRTADGLVSVSDHEGFCVPLIEAMYLDVPVIAYRAGAVADTLGDGGLLIDSKEPSELATAMWRVVSDRALRSRLSQAAAARVKCFTLDRTRAAMSSVLREWMSS
ncbi:MAG: glycosyltransferase, partial [Acidimicrobiales bacterium]